MVTLGMVALRKTVGRRAFKNFIGKRANSVMALRSLDITFVLARVRERLENGRKERKLGADVDRWSRAINVRHLYD